MIQNLGVQLYTVRDYLKDPEFADLTFKKLRELGGVGQGNFHGRKDRRQILRCRAGQRILRHSL